MSTVDAAALGNGWIDWPGGDCPVHPDSKPGVRTESGIEIGRVEIAPGVHEARYWNWKHQSGYQSIIAYRPDPAFSWGQHDTDESFTAGVAEMRRRGEAAGFAQPDPAFTAPAPAGAGDVVEPVYLVTAGSDGAFSKLVVGFDAVKDAVVEAVWGDPSEDCDEAVEMRQSVDDDSEWNSTTGYHLWSRSWSFEDGYIDVQLVTDLGPAIASLEAKVAEVTRERHEAKRKTGSPRWRGR